MPSFELGCFCSVCGEKIKQEFTVPPAPHMVQNEISCESCGNRTHVLLTACPTCGKAFKFFLSDLDFFGEIKQLSNTYVRIIDGIRENLSDYIEEFKVSVPRKWSVRLECNCGHDYVAEIPLRQLRDQRESEEK